MLFSQNVSTLFEWIPFRNGFPSRIYTRSIRAMRSRDRLRDGGGEGAAGGHVAVEQHIFSYNTLAVFRLG